MMKHSLIAFRFNLTLEILFVDREYEIGLFGQVKFSVSISLLRFFSLIVASQSPLL